VRCVSAARGWEQAERGRNWRGGLVEQQNEVAVGAGRHAHAHGTAAACWWRARTGLGPRQPEDGYGPGELDRGCRKLVDAGYAQGKKEKLDLCAFVAQHMNN
jgi:hypothetical protein